MATPSITQSGFDRIETDLRQALRQWWEDESRTFDSAVASAETSEVWEGMPEIDSKAVVKASSAVRRFLGCDLDPRLIRKGGYASFDDLAADLLRKLRESCPAEVPAGASADI